MFVLETKTSSHVPRFDAYVNHHLYKELKIFKNKIGQHMDAGAGGGASYCGLWFGFELMWLIRSAEFAELRTWIKAFMDNRDNTI